MDIELRQLENGRPQASTPSGQQVSIRRVINRRLFQVGDMSNSISFEEELQQIIVHNFGVSGGTRRNGYSYSRLDQSEPRITEIFDDEDAKLDSISVASTLTLPEYPANVPDKSVVSVSSATAWFRLMGLAFVGLLAQISVSSGRTSQSRATIRKIYSTPITHRSTPVSSRRPTRKPSNPYSKRQFPIEYNICFLLFAIFVATIVFNVIYIHFHFQPFWLHLKNLIDILKASKTLVHLLGSMLHFVGYTSRSIDGYISTRAIIEPEPNLVFPPFTPPSIISTPVQFSNASQLIDRILTAKNISFDQVSSSFCENSLQLTNSSIEQCQVSWNAYSALVESKLNASATSLNGDEGYEWVLLLPNGNQLFVAKHSDSNDGGQSTYRVEVGHNLHPVPFEYWVQWVMPIAFDQLLLITSDLSYCIIKISDTMLECELLNHVN